MAPPTWWLQDSQNSYKLSGFPQGKHSKRLRKLQGVLFPSLGASEHHFYHNLLIKKVTKSSSKSRGEEMDSTSQWEESQRKKPF